MPYSHHTPIVFTYPRTLSFYHPRYAVACGGNEVPMVARDHKTYLYVWSLDEKRHEYYCYEDDMFLTENEVNSIWAAAENYRSAYTD